MPSTVHRLRLLLPALLLAVTAGSTAAQAPTIGRLHYDGGGDWYANPSSLPNLLAAIRERTTISTAAREITVALSDPALWTVPYLYLTGHGNLAWSEQDLITLRRWIVRGGFLHVDDNYGLDESFRREIARLFPDRPLVDVPFDHPVYRVVYPFPAGLPKIHDHDGKPAQGLGVFVDGRLAVFYSFQSDLGDGWEDPEVHGDTPAHRESALRMGVNLFAYAIGFVR